MWRLKMQEACNYKKQILILFPCSGDKNPYVYRETFSPDEERRIMGFIRVTRDYLISGREELARLPNIIDFDSEPLSALDRYNGELYKVPNFREKIREAYLEEGIHILIMSGAYGIVFPSERIHYYKKPINAAYWKKYGLPGVIEEYIEKYKISFVYGFFSQSTDYMKIVKNIDWMGLKDKSELQAARTYYVDFHSRGALKIVPRITGELIVSFIDSGFDIENFYQNPFKGQIIKYVEHLLYDGRKLSRQKGDEKSGSMRI